MAHEDCTALPIHHDHFRLPYTASTAYTYVSDEPKYTVPSALMAGAAMMILPVGNAHFSAPVEPLMAYMLLSSDPMNTVPSVATEGDAVSV